MARCTTCYGLNRGKLSGTSTDTQRARHDFWILLKSLAKLEKAAQAGCDVCDVLSSGLLAAIDAKDKVSLNARNVQVEIMIPRPKYNRVRVVARRSSPARVLADLEFYGSSRSTQAPWSEYKRGEVIPSNADFSTYISIIRSWLEICTKSHPQCLSSSSHPRRLPTRVLDLSISDDTVRLIDTRVTPSKPLPYIALSYCWGPSPSSLPKTFTHTALPHDHRIAHLPSSLRDAIRLTRALHIRYLWIDSLCILQNCPCDWEAESSRMQQYYSGAFLVLAASRVASPATAATATGHGGGGGGFLQPRAACEVVHPRARRPTRTPSPTPPTGATRAVAAAALVICRKFSPHLASDQDRTLHPVPPLDGRAWALQERISAARIVHFYDEEMVWECDASTACECGRLSATSRALENGALPLKVKVRMRVSGGLRPGFGFGGKGRGAGEEGGAGSGDGTAGDSLVRRGLDVPCKAGSRMSRGEGFRAWADLVGHYAACALTQDGDKLPAIGGLARIFASNEGFGRYVAGLWEGMLLPGLLWRVEDAERARRPREYVAPSWSWASLVGKVDWKCIAEYRLRFMAQVLDCKTVCSGADAFGKVERGMVRIRARVWETQVEYQPASGFMALTSGESAYFDANGECRRNTSRLYPRVKCVVIAKGSSRPGLGTSVLFALVVKKSRVEGATQRYERIGLAVLDPKRLETAVEETVIID